MLRNSRGKKGRFLKKAAQKLSNSGPGAFGPPTPQAQIQESFLLLFYKKAGLPLLKSLSLSSSRQG
jgi:hypothetical protein